MKQCVFSALPRLIGPVLVALLAGCASQTLSPAIITQAGGPTNFAELSRGPELFAGKMLILGGVIVKATNRTDGTLLEVYQTKLDADYRPIEIDVSEGRFLALYKGFLDSEIYRPGRKVTVAGLGKGEWVMKLGDLDYHYPYLELTELHLFAEEQPWPDSIYPPGYFYSPWYPWYPHHLHRPWFPGDPDDLWYPY